MSFRPRKWSEEEFTQLVKNRDRGTIDRVMGGGVRTPTQATRAESQVSSDRRTNGNRSAVATQKPRLPAGSNPAPSPYKSKWEEQFAYELTMEKRAGMIKAFWYEPFSLWLPGKVRYKPDFMVDRGIWKPEPLELIEVKGWSKNRRDGMTRLKIAAALFPCFVWRLVYRTQGGGWDGEYI